MNLSPNDLVNAYQDACIELHLTRRRVDMLEREVERLRAALPSEPARGAHAHPHPHDDGEPVTHVHAEAAPAA